MSVVAPFAYAADGEVYACGDGPELFCYSGSDDTPLWKQFCDGLLVGVGASTEGVHSLDDHGNYALWDARSGDNRVKTALGGTGLHLAVCPTGDALALTDRGATRIGPDGTTWPLSMGGATVAAWTPDGQRAVFGTPQGELVLFDMQAGTKVGLVALGAPVVDVGWSGQGEWVVLAGNQLIFVAADVVLPPPSEGAAPPSPVRRTVPVQGTPGHVTANVDGVLVACDDGANNVLIYETNQYKCGGTIAYQRPLGDLDFGPGTLLGVGLEYADANRIEVLSGQTERSKPGLGKGNAPWFPRVQLDQYVLRGAVATKRAGGKPIANVRQVEKTGGNRTLLFVGIGVAVAVLCCGGLGTALAVWRFLLS
jgi:hypothetical protein